MKGGCIRRLVDHHVFNFKVHSNEWTNFFAKVCKVVEASQFANMTNEPQRNKADDDIKSIHSSSQWVLQLCCFNIISNADRQPLADVVMIIIIIPFPHWSKNNFNHNCPSFFYFLAFYLGTCAYPFALFLENEPSHHLKLEKDSLLSPIKAEALCSFCFTLL